MLLKLNNAHLSYRYINIKRALAILIVLIIVQLNLGGVNIKQGWYYNNEFTLVNQEFLEYVVKLFLPP